MIKEETIAVVSGHLHQDTELFMDYLQSNHPRIIRGEIWACCPFHKEDTPSFKISQNRGTFYCFGCHQSGSLMNFVGKLGNQTFPETIESLAQRYGVRVEYTGDPKQREERDRMRELLASAQSHFTRNLTETSEGRNALAYILNRRIPQRVISLFELGYAEDSWDDLLNFLNRQGFSLQECVDGGLIAKTEKREDRETRQYDRFRGRLMFPIFDNLSRLAGFIGRIIGSESQPTAKYINSPETSLYKKSGLLYGLNRAIEKSRKEGRLYIVEGPVDVLAMHAQKIENCCAPCGTAFSQEHAELLKRLFLRQDKFELIFVYDGDKAGERGALRSGEIAFQAGLNPRVILSPEGEDPASINEKGENIQDVIRREERFFDFFYRTNYTSNSFDDRIALAKKVGELLSKKSGPRRIFSDEFARKIGVSEEAIAEITLPEKSRAGYAPKPAIEREFLIGLAKIAKRPPIARYFTELAKERIEDFSEFGRAFIYYLETLDESGLSQGTLFNPGLNAQETLRKIKQIAESRGIAFQDSDVDPRVIDGLFDDRRNSVVSRADLETCLVRLQYASMHSKLNHALLRGISTSRLSELLGELEERIRDET